MLRGVIAACVIAANAVQAQMTDLERGLRDAFQAGKLDALHAVLIRRNGETLAELYFAGQDERWGAPIGIVDHGPDTLHDLRSISKSVTGLLYGIALDKGLVPDPGTPLLAQFPGMADLSTPKRDRITIADVLTMRMGIEWNETTLPYSDPRNSEIAMERAEDRYRFVLSRPVVDAPGTRWVYNGGASALLGGIIERGSGMALDEFARAHLFAPLEITEFDWVAGWDGVPSAASGLRLRARDLARIGEMIAAGGMFDGQRIVSRAWLDRMSAPRAAVEPLRYGYHWWLSPVGDPPNWIAGFGNGGQRMSINPRLGLVVVVFGGRYDDPNAWELPVSVITDHIVPALGLP